MIMIGLSVLLYLAALSAPCLGIPIYGTTRYGRPSTGLAPPPAPFYYRPARFYPYADTYNDIYYRSVPIVHNPYYRPEDVYRVVHPYYYAPYYYGTEDAYEQSDDALRDDGSHVEGSSRSDSLPVGQETWFESDSNPAWRNEYDDVNAAFLQNLIMSQMYDDAMDRSSSESNEETEKELRKENSNFDHKTQDYYGERDTRDFEDEDVRELKALAGKPLYHVPKTSLQYPVNHNEGARKPQIWHQEYTTTKPVVIEDEDEEDDYQNDEGWINWGSKRSSKPVKTESVKKVTTKKPIAVSTSTSTMKPTLSNKIPATVITLGGQKEEVLLRPATPARQPFPEPVLRMMETNNMSQNKRSPSVYDTIKRLLSMEESYKQNSENKGRMQKRFISTEEDLVGELKGLKLKRRSSV